MSSLKISVIGAGSYVFGPSVLNQSLCENRFDNIELSLHDLDDEAVKLMARVGKRMAREHGLTSQVTATTNRRESLDGASFIIYCAAPQLKQRFAMDTEIIARHAPGEYLGEFGGIAGISYSLRQIALMEEIAADIRKICPDARLLCTANPLPRVVQAAHQLGVKAIGFCSVSSAIFSDFNHFMGEPKENFPWTKAREKWDVTMGGLNHFSWLLDVREKATGRDFYPQFRERIAAGETTGNPRNEALLKELGYLLLPCDDHTIDFLPYDPRSQKHEIYHGNTLERSERLRILHDIAEDRADWRQLVLHPSWERPPDLIGALALNRPASFNSLNLLNEGQIPQLPPKIFVETPATADATGIHPQKIELPDSLLPMTSRTARVTDLIVRAALNRNRTQLHEAVDLDPTILNKDGAKAALDECIQAHLKTRYTN
jgi:alpha-galactosidase